MKPTIEKIVGNVISIRSDKDEYRIIVDPEGIHFERYHSSTNMRETLQEVVNTIRANRKKRERVWRADPPSDESDYSMLYVKF